MMIPGPCDPVRVTHIIPGLDIGGAETALYRMLSMTDRNRIQPSVVCLGNMGVIGNDIELLGVPVYLIGMRSGMFNASKMRKLILILNELNPDIIQGWMYHGNLLATLASFFLHRKIPVLWNVRSLGTNMSRNFAKMSVYWLTGRFSRFPSKIVNNSKVSAETHERKMNYPCDKWVVIPNGFETGVFRPDRASRDKLRVLLNLDPHATLIGHVARYDPIKDHSSFLSAAAHLVKDGTDVHFALIGPNIDHDNGELVQRIEELGLRKHVHLFGARRDLPLLMPGFDIGCLSSYGEGFPNVVGEMMSSGVPCVVTDVGDCAWLVGDTGRVVPARDPVGLAAALKGLIDLGMEEREKIGGKARQRIIRNFSLDSVVRRYEELYEQVSEKNRKS